MPFHTIPHCSGTGQVFQAFHSVPPLRSTVEHLPLLQMMATEPVRNDKVVPEPVISLNSRSPKAYYRAGFALLILNRGHDALDVYGRAGDGAMSCGGFKALCRRVEKECDEL